MLPVQACLLALVVLLAVPTASASAATHSKKPAKTAAKTRQKPRAKKKRASSKAKRAATPKVQRAALTRAQTAALAHAQSAAETRAQGASLTRTQGASPTPEPSASLTHAPSAEPAHAQAAEPSPIVITAADPRFQRSAAPRLVASTGARLAAVSPVREGATAGPVEHAYVDPTTREVAPVEPMHVEERDAQKPAAAGEPSETATDEEADEADGGEGGDEGEAESDQAVADAGPPGVRYSRDLSDAELQRRWTQDLPALGSISVGFADQGRLINGVQLKNGEGWVCVRPERAWGTQETIDSLTAAARVVRARFPDSAPLRVNDIGVRDGGHLRPHRSHQSGRDVDLGLFYKKDQMPGGRGKRDKFVDAARNWTLLKTLLTESDVQVVLVDRGIQAVLRTYALEQGEDPQFVRAVFSGSEHRKALVQHAKKHRDHFHVRFYAARSQELGRRIQPLLAERPDQNLVVHKVKRGQTVGHIAKAYGTTTQAVLKANHLRKPFLHAGQRLLVPLRKACTRCPVPPPVVVPERILPADMLAARAAAAKAPAVAAAEVEGGPSAPTVQPGVAADPVVAGPSVAAAAVAGTLPKTAAEEPLAKAPAGGGGAAVPPAPARCQGEGCPEPASVAR